MLTRACSYGIPCQTYLEQELNRSCVCGNPVSTKHKTTTTNNKQTTTTTRVRNENNCAYDL
eukprot:5454298-Heterocapsa_arctica.AAC.1